jgi:hypothetical protein
MTPRQNPLADRGEDRIRKEFDRVRLRYRDDVRALEIVAIELDLSLEDCATAIAREDLIEHSGTPWRIEFPAIGPPAFRRD